MELSPEERKIVEKYRTLGDWDTLEVSKQNGKLYTIRQIAVERYKELAPQTTVMV
jgi:hypothetical protein